MAGCAGWRTAAEWLAAEFARRDTRQVSLVSAESRTKLSKERFFLGLTVREESGRTSGTKALPSLLPHNSSGIPRKTLSQKAADEGSDWESGLGPSHADARPQVEQKNKDVMKVVGQ